MLIMKLISMILLTTCLNACDAKDVVITLPYLKNHDRCAPFIQRIGDTNTYTGKCRCQTYQVAPIYTGPLGESYDMPLEYCSNRVSFKPTVWSDEYLYFFDEIFFMARTHNPTARRNQ